MCEWQVCPDGHDCPRLTLRSLFRRGVRRAAHGNGHRQRQGLVARVHARTPVPACVGRVQARGAGRVWCACVRRCTAHESALSTWPHVDSFGRALAAGINSRALLVTCHDAEKFPSFIRPEGRGGRVDGCFDRVLCDVPCTGERCHRQAVVGWVGSTRTKRSASRPYFDRALLRRRWLSL